MDSIKNFFNIFKFLIAMAVLSAVLTGCAEKAPASGNSGENGKQAGYSFSKEINNPELLCEILDSCNLGKEKKTELTNTLLDLLSDIYSPNTAITVTSLDELKLINGLLRKLGAEELFDPRPLIKGDALTFPENESYYETLFETGYLIVTAYWYPAYNVERSYKCEKAPGQIKISAEVTEFEEVATGMTAFFDFIQMDGSPEGEAIELTYSTVKWQNPEKSKD